MKTAQPTHIHITCLKNSFIMRLSLLADIHLVIYFTCMFFVFGKMKKMTFMGAYLKVKSCTLYQARLLQHNTQEQKKTLPAVLFHFLL